MQQYRKNLGKVSLTAEGVWNLNNSYDILSIVYDEHTQHGFISRKAVPQGVDLYNKEYWMPLNVSGYADNNVIILSKKTSEASIQSYTLEEAIASIKSIGRRPGSILGFYNENNDRLDIGGRWELWQFNDTNVYNWENVDSWQNLYYNYNKFMGWFKDENFLTKYAPFPEIGCYAFVGSEFNEATVYRCDNKYVWNNTTQHAWDYVKVIVDGNVTVGENGNWFNNGEDTGIPASVKGENGKTPIFREKDNTIQYSFDNVNWITISGKVAAWFRWNATTGDTQANNVGRIQISRDNVTWTNLSGDIINNLHISRYIGADETLPTSGIAEGTICAKGPTYDTSDTSHANPIYRLWVYAWKGNTIAWQDNGEFTSIAAGVVQETGDSETEVMSQKAVSAKLSELSSEISFLLSKKEKSLKSLRDITKSSGLLDKEGGLITYDSNFHHTAPIELKKGQSVIYRGYTYSTLNANIFNLVKKDGVFLQSVDYINGKQTNSSDYSRDNVSIYTATEDCYVSVNLFTPNEVDWDLASVYIGVLFDIWTKFNTERKNTNKQIVEVNDKCINIDSHIKELELKCDNFDNFIVYINSVLNGLSFKEGTYITNNGNIGDASADVNYHADSTYYKLGDFIKAKNIGMGNNFPIIAFYDVEKKYIDKVSNVNSTTDLIDIYVSKDDYPLGAVYCRFAYYGNNLPFIERGGNTIDDIQHDIVSLKKDTRVVDYTNEGSLFVNGGYINMSGNLVVNESFSYTDYLEIPFLKDIELIQCQVGNQYMAAIAFYDESKTFISALQRIGSTQIGNAIVEKSQIPMNTKYIRVSGKMIDDSYYSYVNYYAAATDLLKGQKDNCIVSKEKFKSFSNNKKLNPNETLILPYNKVKVNSLLSAKILGVIECVNIGVGYVDSSSKRTYEARWIELTQTQVKLFGYYNADNVLHFTYNHGLTLTDKTFVSVTTDTSDKNKTATTKLIISNDRGESFEQEFGWGQGAAFVENKNTNGSVDVSLQFMPRDLLKKIWVFGDSYFTYWPTYLYRLGFNRWLRNSQPGSSPSAGYSELQNLLSLGYTPNYVLWCLGMNGDTSEQLVDEKYVINDYQKTYIDSVKALCDRHNIELVLMTIPTVPSRQKTGFRDYVKSLGVRYIDIYNAVGADEYGIWHGKPTLRAWSNSGNIVYTQIIGDGHAYVSVNDRVFSGNGVYIGSNVEEVDDSNTHIVVNGVTYTRDEQRDVVGLLSSDGVHPTDEGAKVIAYAVMSEFSEIGLSE